MDRGDRMGEPFIRRRLNVEMAAKRFDRRDIAGAIIDHIALFMIERAPLGLALDDVGTKKGTQLRRNTAQADFFSVVNRLKDDRIGALARENEGARGGSS